MPEMNLLLAEVEEALVAARYKHAPMHSPHEGWSVIFEELEELREHVRADTGRSADARKEAIQIAAMGLRYALDLCAEEADRDHTILVMSGPAGPSLYLDDYRIAGPKPWGGGAVLHEFACTDKDLIASGVTLAATPAPLDVERLARWLYAEHAKENKKRDPNGVWPERWEDSLWWQVNEAQRPALIAHWADKARTAIAAAYAEETK
jgi:hypothetical protein